MIPLQQMIRQLEAINPAGPITKADVEVVLDAFIQMELSPEPIGHAQVIQHGERIIRKYGEQIYSAHRSHKEMQDVFYSFSNQYKYRLSADICMLVRGTLEHCWDGIGEWRA